MKEIELRKHIQSLKLKCSFYPGVIEIIKEEQGYYDTLDFVIARVSRTQRYELDMLGYRFLMDMDLDLKEKLFDTLSEFARTPVEER